MHSLDAFGMRHTITAQRRLGPCSLKETGETLNFEHCSVFNVPETPTKIVVIKRNRIVIIVVIIVIILTLNPKPRFGGQGLVVAYSPRAQRSRAVNRSLRTCS